jgi:hypothetical protein
MHHQRAHPARSVSCSVRVHRLKATALARQTGRVPAGAARGETRFEGSADYGEDSSLTPNRSSLITSVETPSEGEVD